MSTTTLPPGLKRHGKICDPSLYTNTEYYPLLLEVAKRSDISPSVKLFHAVCLRRARSVQRRGVIRYWFSIDKLQTLSGLSRKRVYADIETLKEKRLIVQGKYGSHHILESPGGSYLDALYRKEFELLNYASIPSEVYWAGLSDKAVILYGILVRHANSSGQVFATKAQMASACGSHPKTIMLALRELKSAALIKADCRCEKRIHVPGRSGPGECVYFFLDHRIFDPK